MPSRKSAIPRSVPLVSCRLVRERETGYRRRTITTSQQAHAVVREFIADRDREVVVVLCLDTKRRLYSPQQADLGTLADPFASAFVVGLNLGTAEGTTGQADFYSAAHEHRTRVVAAEDLADNIAIELPSTDGKLALVQKFYSA